MSVEYIESVKKATKDLFSTMMMMELVAKDPIARDNMDEVVITGNIGLAGEYKGNIAIHFSKGLALKSIAAMLGMEMDELTDDCQDAIGEIANIVAGGVKTELSQVNVNFDLSLPSVIMGKNYSVFYADASASGEVIIPFEFESEIMYVEYRLETSES